MAVALSGSIVLAGSITGSLLGTSSYSSNAELLDGLDSSVFALTSSLSTFSSSLNGFTASINTYTASNNDNITALNAATASLYNATASINSYTASNNANITALYAATSSLYNATASLYNATSSIYLATASLNAATASLNQYTRSLNLNSSSFATTGSNTFVGNQYISSTSIPNSFTATASLYTDGGLRVSKDAYISGTAYFNNVTVFGTQSVNYITSSQLNIATNIITVNTSTPTVRFGGLAVYDSGSLSTGLTGSILWDSQDNQWIYSNPSGSAYDSSLFLVGPRSTGPLGNEVGITVNSLAKGDGAHHMTSSNIFDVSGSIGIGTTTPSNTLQVVGGVTATSFTGGSISGTTGTFSSDVVATGSFTVAPSNAVEFQVQSAGVTIGNISADSHNVTGSLKVSGSFTATQVTSSTNMLVGSTLTVNASALVSTNIGIGSGTGTNARLHISASGPSPLLRIDSVGVGTAMFVSSSGNVGIGMATPTGSTLTVSGNIWATSITSSGNMTALNITASGTFNSYGSGFITSGGNIGIGTSLPLARFHISQSIANPLRIDIPGTGTAMFVSSSGNVGIGTLSPATLLALAGSTATTFGLSLEPAGWNNARHRWTVPTSGDTSVWSFNWNGSTADSALYAVSSISVTQGVITFGTTGSANAPTERMRIDSVGNVGIGTTTPGSKLEIYNSNGDTRATITSTGGTGASDVMLKNASGTVAYEWLVQGLGSDGRFRIYDNAGVNTGERFTIDQTGNVGIGTSSTNARLDLGPAPHGTRITWENYSNVFSEYSSGDLWLSSNFYGVSGSSGYKTSVTAAYGAAGIAISGTGGGLNGVIKFFVDDAASKTGGASFTPTERMRIKGDGNVGIGITSPSVKLDISGSIRSEIESDGNFITLQSTTQRVHYIKRSGQILQFTSDGSNAYNVQFDSSNRSVYFATGSVGIGTTSPSTPLEISAATGTQFKIGTNDSTSANNAGILFYNEASSNSATRRSYVLLDPNGANGSGGDYSYFDMYGSGAARVMNQLTAGTLSLGVGGTNIINITGSSIGISTTSPSYKLDVAGDFRTSGRQFINGLTTLAYKIKYDGFSMAGGYIADADASDGTAAYLNSASGSTFFFGPYTSMTPGEYVASFRMKVASNSSTSQLGQIDASGTNVTGSAIIITPSMFEASNRYQYIDIPFTVNGSASSIEFRGVGFNTGITTIYLDHVLIKPLAKGYTYIIPESKTYNIYYHGVSTPRLTINTSGNIGIGTTSPSTTLHVRTDTGVLIKGASSTTDAILSLIPASGGRQYDLRNYGSSFGIKDNSADTIRMYFHYDGNVGIGNTSPLTKLHVNNAVAGAILPYIQGTGLSYNSEGISVAGSNTNNTNIGNGITFYNNVASVGAYGPVAAWSSMTVGGAYNSTYAFITGVYGGAGGDSNWAIGDLIFGTAESYGATERMRIRYNGNVGIGTTSPTELLHVSNGYILIGTDKGIKFDTSGASGHPELSIDSNAALNFKNTAGSTNVIITNGGNVGIGTTSGAADGLTIRREGGDTRTLLQLDRPNTPGLKTNIRFTVADIMVGKIQHEYIASNYNHMSFTLRSPGGSDVIPLWLENSGNVGIGTTSPQYKLDVNGTIAATRLNLGYDYYNAYTINSSWSSLQTIIPANVLESAATYLLVIRGTGVNASPYEVNASTVFTTCNANSGGATNNVVTLLTSTHTGSGALIEVAALCGSGQVCSGMSAKLTSWGNLQGTLYVYAIKLKNA